MQELEAKLREDLLNIGLVEDFTLSLRPYSKSYFGRFDPNTDTVIVYVQKQRIKTFSFHKFYLELLNH